MDPQDIEGTTNSSFTLSHELVPEVINRLHLGADQQGTVQHDSVAEAEGTSETGNGICILSFDSGGPGTISQLRMIEELVKRIESGSHKKENETRPADYFDLMGGVGFGGLAALLLGRLHMTADQAMDELSLIGTATFPKEINQSMKELHKLTTLLQDENGMVVLLLMSCLSLIITQAMKHLLGIATVTSQAQENTSITREMNMGRLRKAIESMLERNDLPIDMMLREDSIPRCKVVVFASTACNMAHGQPFRTYSSRGSSLDCTFVDAACAILASPEFFSPVTIGPELRKQKFAGTPPGHGNPRQIVSEEVRREFGDNIPIALVLSLGSGQFTVLASSCLTSGRDLRYYTTTLTRWARQDCERVAEEISHQLSDRSVHLRLNVEKGLENIQYSDWHDLGSVVSHTNAYLQLSRITAYVDEAVHLILKRDGSVTLREMIRKNTGSSISRQVERLISPLEMQGNQVMNSIQLLSESITFVDSVGNRIPIPLHFCGTFKQLEVMILLHFDQKRPPGSGLVKKGRYQLISGKDREVVGPTQWTAIVRPKLEVEIAMVLYDRNMDITGCPRCGQNSGGVKDAWVTCSNMSCTGQFQITDKLVDEELVSPAVSKNARKSTSEGIRHILNETDTMADHAGIVQPLEPDNEDQAHILRSPGDAVADKMPKPDDPNEKKLFRLISVINRLSITHIPIISSPGLDAVSLVLDAASLPTTAGTSGTDETLLSPASNLDLYYLSRIAAKSAALDTVLYSVIISLLQRPDALLKEIPYDQCRTFDSTPYGPERTCSLLTKGKACNLKFGRGDRFKHHIQQHLGIRPYPCAGSKTVHPCNLSFSSTALRDNHVRNKDKVRCVCSIPVARVNLGRHRRMCSAYQASL